MPATRHTHARRALPIAAALATAILVGACSTTPSGPGASGGLLPLDGSFAPLGGGSGSAPPLTSGDPAPSSPPGASDRPAVPVATDLGTLATRIGMAPGYSCQPEEATTSGRQMYCSGMESGGQTMVVLATGDPTGALTSLRIDVAPADGTLLDDDLVATTFAWIVGMHAANATPGVYDWIREHASTVGAAGEVPPYALSVEVGPGAADQSLARRLTVLIGDQGSAPPTPPSAAPAAGGFDPAATELVTLFDVEMECEPARDDSRIGYRVVDCRQDVREHTVYLSATFDEGGTLASVLAAAESLGAGDADHGLAVEFFDVVLDAALDDELTEAASQAVASGLGTFTTTPLGELVLETDYTDDRKVLIMELATPAYRDAPAVR